MMLNSFLQSPTAIIVGTIAIFMMLKTLLSPSASKYILFIVFGYAVFSISKLYLTDNISITDAYQQVATLPVAVIFLVSWLSYLLHKEAL